MPTLRRNACELSTLFNNTAQQQPYLTPTHHKTPTSCSAKEGEAVRNSHYHSGLAVIRAFTGIPRVTDAVLLRVVLMLTVRTEQLAVHQLAADYAEAIDSYVEPWMIGGVLDDAETEATQESIPGMG